MPEKIIHLDSKNSNYLLNPNNTTLNTRNSFHTNYKLSQEFSKIKKISLLSLEMPIAFNNIRYGSTNVFSFLLNGTQRDLSMKEMNHSSIDTLITDLNLRLYMYIGLPVIITASVNSNNRIRLNFSGMRPITFSIIDTNFSYNILGFRSSIDKLIDMGGETTSVTTIINGIINITHSTSFTTSTSNYYCLASQSMYNLNPDNYISLFIPQLSGCVADMNGSNTTIFKIPMNCIYGMTYFFQENLNFKQQVEITDKNFRLTDLTITVYDRYGKNIENNGLDYSLSLLIEYDY